MEVEPLVEQKKIVKEEEAKEGSVEEQEVKVEVSEEEVEVLFANALRSLVLKLEQRLIFIDWALEILGQLLQHELLTLRLGLFLLPNQLDPRGYLRKTHLNLRPTLGVFALEFKEPLTKQIGLSCLSLRRCPATLLVQVLLRFPLQPRYLCELAFVLNPCLVLHNFLAPAALHSKCQHHTPLNLRKYPSEVPAPLAQRAPQQWVSFAEHFLATLARHWVQRHLVQTSAHALQILQVLVFNCALVHIDWGYHLFNFQQV